MVDIEDLVCPHIKELSPYSSARDEISGVNAENGVFLDANENPYGPFNRYPDPYQNRLKNKISELKGVTEKQIFPGNGSDEIIDLLFKVFCISGSDKVMIFEPTFGMYQTSARINNIGLVPVELTDSFEINLDEVAAHLDDSGLKMIFICSPNNPTGNTFSRSTIQYLLENFHGIVIVDEAYIDFSSTVSWSQSVNDYPNLVVLQTLSKAWGMAGFRLGTAFSNSNIINYLNKVKMPYNISSLTQKKAIERLDDRETFRDQIDTLLKERKRVAAELDKLNIVEKVYPSETNFILLEVKDANELHSQLARQNIVVRNRSKQVDQCLRITIGRPEENDQLLTTLKQISE